MIIAKWGNSLAIRLPASVVEELGLKEGDDVAVRVAADRAFEIIRKPSPDEMLARLRRYRGRLPADFLFDRADAHDR